MRIAIVDDDFLVRDLMKALTDGMGHLCHPFETGEQLLQALRRETYDLLVVDWHLPDLDGPEVVRAARLLTGPAMPILFVTRRNDEQDIVEALASGADDFMSKPISVGEFSARIKALLRRAYPESSQAGLVFGCYGFNETLRIASLNDTPIELTDREYALALVLFQNCGRLLSRDHLRELVWGQIHDVPSRTIDTHVSRLRSKLKMGDETGYQLMAVYGVGYRLEKNE